MSAESEPMSRSGKSAAFRILSWVSATLLFAMLALTFADVIGRYFLNAPVPAAAEIIGMLLGVKRTLIRQGCKVRFKPEADINHHSCSIPSLPITPPRLAVYFLLIEQVGLLFSENPSIAEFETAYPAAPLDLHSFRIARSG
jgi:hypothetical protein|tara:strand:+ start:405 stop:830 length:426 start_codon:yes stop_codon:yes gene_type:complete